MGNFLDDASASFEDGTLGIWVAYGPTISNSTDRARAGTHSMKAVGANNNVIDQIYTPAGFAVTGGTVSSFGFSYWSAAAHPGPLQLYIFSFYSGGGGLCSSLVEEDEVASSSWRDLSTS